MTLDNQTFTQRRFGSADDLARRGNLPLDALLEAFEPDARPWFSSVGRHPGARLAGAAARHRPRPAPAARPPRRDRRCSARRTGRWR